MAANEGVTKAIAGFYRDYLGMVFLGLSYYLNFPILHLPTFSGFSPCHYHRISVNVPATFADLRRLSEGFRTLPKCSQMFRKRLSTPKLLKRRQLFVRTQKKYTVSYHLKEYFIPKTASLRKDSLWPYTFCCSLRENTHSFA